MNKIYYNPKEFRGSKSRIRSSFNLKIAVLLISVGMLGVVWEFAGLKDKVYEYFGWENSERRIRETRQDGYSLKSDSLVGPLLEKSSAKTKLCEKNESVDPIKVAEYLEQTKRLLEEMSSTVSKMSSNGSEKAERIRKYNSYVTAVNQSADFYNRYLTKCFVDNGLAVEVSKRADVLGLTLAALKEKL